MNYAFDTPNFPNKSSGWDNELSEPKRTFIVPAKCEAEHATTKTGGIETPILKELKAFIRSERLPQEPEGAAAPGGPLQANVRA